MKSRWSLLWNPFKRIAGWQAFVVGAVIVIATGIIGAYANLAFDGALDAHIVEHLSIWKSLSFLGISLLSAVVVMYLAGLIVAKGFRFVDILGTMTLARAPFLLLAILALFVTSPSVEDIMANPLAVLSCPSLMIFAIVSIPIIVWYIALLYNAFKVSTGVSGAKLTIAFILGLLVAEIISKALIHFIVGL